MERLAEAVVRLTAICALSAALELLLPEGTKKKGVRFLFGLSATLLIARVAAALIA
ncbi:MAG: hypothetical protein GX592_11030 [Clostridiales bacterium]|nr:hypothetical protein [Clostridiales bacterium]